MNGNRRSSTVSRWRLVSLALLLQFPIWFGGCPCIIGPCGFGTPLPDGEPSGDDGPPSVDLPCISCHSSTMGSRPAVVNADGAGSHHLGAGFLTNADCPTCHDVSEHQQGKVRLWDTPNTRASVIVLDADPSTVPAEGDKLITFCQTCHSDAAFAVHGVSGDWRPACTACHALHNPANANLSFVADVVRNQTLGEDKPVVFTARTGPGSFSDGVGANDGICQACHTATTHHLHDGGGTAHNEGADCTSCHTHAGGFIPSGAVATSCIGCHSSPQGSRREVVGEFGRASHHVQGAQVSDDDCQVCHDMTQHQQGQVRLKNADDPNNPAAVVSLSADPTSSPTEAAKLEPICLACHDNDGAAGVAPFSDGRMPPPIDAALWASASHATGQTTCMGDGETFGCHSTVHGSVKAHLLAPADGSSSGPVGDASREEEGLCFACHDANGPASTDVEAQFALATRHNVGSLDQADGSRVECIHCHDPHTASAARPLADPDTGAVWTADKELFCLTCHDGSPPAGVSFPASSPGTGYDKSAFVGTTHDTETGSDSCTRCHSAHGSPHLAILKERYVVDDYNAYSPGNGDYAACWLCHDENRIIEQENVFERRHKKHVKNEDAPCIACHDAHRGFDAGEPGLIDLDASVRRGFDIGFIDGRDGSTSFWIDAARNRGNCYIECHGKKHKPKHYDRD